MLDCEECMHKRICDLWRKQECQSASCFVNDCFTPKNGWISVKEKLPEKLKYVLTYSPNKALPIMSNVYGIQLTPFGDVSDGFLINTNSVTHWMPLPEPPEEDANE